MTYSTNTFTASKQAGGGSGAVQSSTYTDSGTTSGSGEQLLRQGSTFYDTALTRVANGQRGDITDQIREYNALYGSSDNTQAGGLAASKSLLYAPAPTMQQAQVVKTTIAAFTFNLVGQVGLFGAENYYVRVDVDILNYVGEEFIEGDYIPADIEYGAGITVNTYEPADLIFNVDPPPPNPRAGSQEPPEQQASISCCSFIGGIPNDPILNCYYAAEITERVNFLSNALISVDLNNIGVNNIYIDTWLETMLYTRDQKMWGFDKMYIRPKDHFYIGVHARNTRHLPYNIDVIVGNEVTTEDQITEKRLISTGQYY